MTSSEFSEYYKSLSDAELLHILANEEDYQPIALEAAKKELETRKLSPIQIKEAEGMLTAQKMQDEKRKENSVEEKVKSGLASLIETLNPIQSGTPSSEKIIRFIVIVLSGLFLYEIITEFKMIREMLEDFADYPATTLILIFPLITLPLSIITFWKRKSVGWTLLAVFLVFSAISVIGILIQALLWQPSKYAVLDSLFPKPAIMPALIQLLFFGGNLFAICRKDIRKIFPINKKEMTNTIVITAIPSLLLVLILQ